MAKVKVYNLDGTQFEEMVLKDKVFDVAPNEELLHQAVVGYLSNKRAVYAHTKTRAEVRGGGRKPWRQKGTGRARHGSIRSPLWVGGGITFGPRKNRNFEVKINKKVKNKALSMLLTDKLKNDELIVIDKLNLTEAKTKELFSVIKGLFGKLAKEFKAKIILADKGDRKVKLASRNIKEIETIEGKDLNVLDVINSRYIVIEKKVIMDLEKRLTK